LYETAVIRLPNVDISNPKDILDNMENEKVKFYKYLLNIIKDVKNDAYNKDMLLHNAYTDYMSFMTNIPIMVPKDVKEYFEKPSVEVEDVDEYREMLKE